MMDPFERARATLAELEREQVERFRPREPEPREREPQRPAGVSIPALEGDAASVSPLARADLAAAYGMVEVINRLQAEGSISTPLLGGDR